MPDREKVIRGLVACNFGDCTAANGCPYARQTGCMDLVFKDAITLLREQEPVKPGRECSGGGTTWWNVCGACRTAINPNDKYCHECGRAVKWDA